MEERERERRRGERARAKGREWREGERERESDGMAGVFDLAIDLGVSSSAHNKAGIVSTSTASTLATKASGKVDASCPAGASTTQNGDEDSGQGFASITFAYSVDREEARRSHRKDRERAAKGRKFSNQNASKHQQNQDVSSTRLHSTRHKKEKDYVEDNDATNDERKTSSSLSSSSSSSTTIAAAAAGAQYEKRSDEAKYWVEAEEDLGCVEYKLKLVNVNSSRFEHLVTQLKFRLSQGEGKCEYLLGVEDNGFCRGLKQEHLKRSVCTLVSMCNSLTSGTSACDDNLVALKCVQAMDTMDETPIEDSSSASAAANVTSSHQNQPHHSHSQSSSSLSQQQLYSLAVKCFEGYQGKYVKACIRLIPKQHACSYTELRVAMCGAHNAGKSTLMSVLTHGEDRKPLLCNGQGQARSRVFTHKHEVESGRTSSIAHESVAYGKNGMCLNYQTSSACWPLTPLEMSREAGKMLRLFDLSGHERYLKTTCYGMTCLVPDFVMLIVSAQEGVSEMTREHATLARALGSPIFVVVTKIDLIEGNQKILSRGSSGGAVGTVAVGAAAVGMEDLQETKVYQEVKDMLGEKTIMHVKSIEQAKEMSKKLGKQTCNEFKGVSSMNDGSENIVPVIGVSCVNGFHLDLLHAFLKKLRPRDYRRRSSSNTKLNSLETLENLNASSKAAEVIQQQQQKLLHFQVHKTYEVPKVGHVLFGTMLSGKVKVGYQLLLGPLEDGSFSPVRVKSIQRSQVPVNKLTAGQTGTLALDFNQAYEEETLQEGQDTNLKDLEGQANETGGNGRCSKSLSINIPNNRKSQALGGRRVEGLDHLNSSPSSSSYDNLLGSSPRKGTVLVDSQLNPCSERKFRAVVKMVKEQSASATGAAVAPENEAKCVDLTEIFKGSSVVVHCGSIRQAAVIEACREFSDIQGSQEESSTSSEDYQSLEERASLKQDERASLKQEEMVSFYSSPLVMDFKFLHWAEWMKKGSKLVLRSLQTGRLGGVGFVD